MNQSEIKNRIDNLQAELDALKKAAEVPQEWPQEGDKCWFVSGGGHVIVTPYDANNDHIYRSVGNVFRTEAEAQEELHARKVLAKLRAQPGRKGFVEGENNYSLLLYVDRVRCDTWDASDFGWQSIYFDSKQAVQNAIEAVGVTNILRAANWLRRG